MVESYITQEFDLLFKNIKTEDDKQAFINKANERITSLLGIIALANFNASQGVRVNTSYIISLEETIQYLRNLINKVGIVSIKVPEYLKHPESVNTTPIFSQFVNEAVRQGFNIISSKEVEEFATKEGLKLENIIVTNPRFSQDSNFFQLNNNNDSNNVINNLNDTTKQVISKPQNIAFIGGLGFIILMIMFLFALSKPRRGNI